MLGYVKDMILARYFGATGISDVFFVAFRIPNLLRELFAEGSMSSAFIPVLTEYQTMQGREEANRLVRSTFLFILIVVGAVCLAGMAFAPVIVSVIAPGFGDNPGKFTATVLLTRIMFPFLLLISLAALVMGALNTRGAFFIPALAPAMLNVAIIGCVVGFSQLFAHPIMAVAIGVTVGGLVQFLFQLPAFVRKGFSFGLRAKDSASCENDGGRPSRWHPGLKRIGLLLIPSTAAMAVAQINIFVSTILGTLLPEGSVTFLYYAMRLIQFPIGVFGVAVGMAVLPALSEHAVRGDRAKLREDFSFALRLLFFITVPAMAGLIALRVPIVNALFQRGVFDVTATTGTAEALLYYSLGIWAIVGVRTVTATFYSMQDTRTPVKIAVCAMIVNAVASLLLMSPLGHSGLALANSIAASANFVVLFYFLRKRLGGVGTRAIMRSFATTAAASVIMGLAGWYLLRGGPWTSDGQAVLKAAYLSGTIFACAGLYLSVTLLCRSEEAGFILATLRRRLGGSDFTRG